MITGTHLLAISQALADAVGLVSEIDHVMPSPFKFTSKAAFYSSLNADNDTKSEIEEGLINAAWIRYVGFEDQELEDGDVRQTEDPVRLLKYECTIFHEGTFERLDETVPQDAFQKQVRKVNHEHVAAVMGVVGQMQGVNTVAALQPSAFMVAETITPIQTENSQSDVECDFIPGLIGEQTKLELGVMIQTPC